MPGPADALDRLIGREVVLDMASPFVYVGTLAARDQHYLTLTDADVHDLRDTTTTRDAYVIEARRHGVSQNRRTVHVRLDQLVSISALADVIL